jgi:hypothetical protein
MESTTATDVVTRTDWLAALLEDEEAKPLVRLVGFLLASAPDQDMDEYGRTVVTLSARKIGDGAGVTRISAMGATRWLREAGWLEVEAVYNTNGRQPSRYTLTRPADR